MLEKDKDIVNFKGCTVRHLYISCVTTSFSIVTDRSDIIPHLEKLNLHQNLIFGLRQIKSEPNVLGLYKVVLCFVYFGTLTTQLTYFHFTNIFVHH